MARPQGLLFLLEFNRLHVAFQDTAKVRSFKVAAGHGDGSTLLASIPLDEPDNVRHDADSKKVFVGYGDGAWVSLIQK